MNQRRWIRIAGLGMFSGVLMIALFACKPKTTEEPADEIFITEPSAPATPSPTPTSTPIPTPVPTPKAPNAEPGQQGHIFIGNTNVDYNIMLAEDNDYYLERDEKGNKTFRGCIFMDYRNADPDLRRNVILYGHNLKDKSMFTTLHKFETEKFFLENQYMEISLFDGETVQYEIVMTGMLDFRKHNHIKTKFESEEEFLAFCQEGIEYAQFVREGYTPQPGDELVTLSTCVSHSLKDYKYNRMIVVGRKVRTANEPVYTLPPAQANAQGTPNAAAAVEAIPGD